jgi:hypothetical protein
LSTDVARVRTSFRVERWDADQAEWAARKAGRDSGVTEPDGEHFRRYGLKPYLVTEDHDCNIVLQAGWTALLGGIAGTSVTNKLSATNGRIGVGTSTTAASWTQTALAGDTGSGSTTSYYQLVSGAPVIAATSSPATLTLSASFAGSVANFPWNEFGTDNYTASGVTTTGLGAGYILLNRGLSSQGTKSSGQVWVCTQTWSAT